ncbi:MAG: hypothetical protein CMF39_01000 [Legionellaceae bacterium]|nr:hypothetical protein [Legionellaceae bacterium]
MNNSGKPNPFGHVGPKARPGGGHRRGKSMSNVLAALAEAPAEEELEAAAEAAGADAPRSRTPSPTTPTEVIKRRSTPERQYVANKFGSLWDKFKPTFAAIPEEAGEAQQATSRPGTPQ